MTKPSMLTVYSLHSSSLCENTCDCEGMRTLKPSAAVNDRLDSQNKRFLMLVLHLTVTYHLP